MNALIFDTETTGLPNFKLPDNDPSQPHIVQLAAILADEDGNTKGEMNVIIKPTDWSVPSEAAAVHGITTGDAIEFGVPLNLALVMFMELYKKADYLVAHNIDFDLRMLRRYSTKSPDIFTNGLTTNFDTMKAMTDICKIPLTEKQKYAKKYNPNIGDYKQPTLSECVWHLFTQELDGAHNAMVDVIGCKDVFYELKSQGKV